MLNFHVLNVGNGDCIVVEHKKGDERFFGLVDSFSPKTKQPSKGLEKLKELGAESLSFVCLTHPHRDHYRGMLSVLKHYQGKIDQFFVFPAGEYLGSKLKDLAAKYVEVVEAQDDCELTADIFEFLGILKFLDQDIDHERVQQCSGPENKIPVLGFSDVEVTAVLPFLNFKGSYMQRIRKNDPTIFESEDENHLSVVLQFTYAGMKVVLGADASRPCWNERRRWERTRGLAKLRSVSAKLPHHGSKYDCNDEVLEVIFSEDQKIRRTALISANGKTHPSSEVLESLERQGIEPYCTNLHEVCGATVTEMVKDSEIDPILESFLNKTSYPTITQSCQGDICLTIHENGEIEVLPQFKVPCAFRKSSLEFLFGDS